MQLFEKPNEGPGAMSRGPHTFRQGDVTRAVKAVVAAGVGVLRVEVDRAGRIVVVTGKLEENPTPANGDANEWDRI
jgi:hypothetical protein